MYRMMKTVEIHIKHARYLDTIGEALPTVYTWTETFHTQREKGCRGTSHQVHVRGAPKKVPDSQIGAKSRSVCFQGVIITFLEWIQCRY